MKKGEREEGAPNSNRKTKESKRETLSRRQKQLQKLKEDSTQRGNLLQKQKPWCGLLYHDYFNANC